MKKEITDEFLKNVEKPIDLSLEERVSRLSAQTQEKYGRLLEDQEKRKIEFSIKLEKDRPDALQRQIFEELKKLTAPELVPPPYKRSREDIEKEARLNAEKSLREHEQMRLDRLNDVMLTERKYFVGRAEGKENSMLKKGFERTQPERKGIER